MRGKILFATKIVSIVLRWAALEIMSLTATGQASASTQIFMGRNPRLLNNSDFTYNLQGGWGQAMKLDPLTLFGLFSVSLGLVFYALEPKSNWYVLGFAIACALGSVYGFLEGAWPFGVVEIAWTVIALRRFWLARQGIETISH